MNHLLGKIISSAYGSIPRKLYLHTAIVAIFLMIVIYINIWARDTLTMITAIARFERTHTVSRVEAMVAILKFYDHKKPEYLERFQAKLAITQSYNKVFSRLLSMRKDTPDAEFVRILENTFSETDHKTAVIIVNRIKVLHWHPILQELVAYAVAANAEGEALKAQVAQLFATNNEFEKMAVFNEIEKIENKFISYETSFSKSCSALSNQISSYINYITIILLIISVGFTSLLSYLISRTFIQEAARYSSYLEKEIQDRKQMEVVLRESELTFRKLFEESSDAILLIDETGVFVECNQSALDLLKLTREQFLFLPPVSISPEFQPNGHKSKESALEMIELAYKKGLHRFDWTCVNSQGGEFIVDVSLMPIVVKGKTMLHTTWRNITDRKQAEAEKLIAQKSADDNEKMALVGQIAGKMAHDFNNILGIIMGHTGLSILDCKDDQIKKTLELIYEQTIRGKNLTKNLVAFAKDQEPKQEFFRVSDKIDLVLNLMRKDLEGIELVKEVSPDVPELLADPGMIEHALVNLIQNSIHALSMVEYPRITMRTYSRDNDICFEIEDNGCGISKENLEHIYELSFSLKGSRDVTGSYKAGIKGTGYGMSNVKTYIELHKGSISVESELGSGTKFIISLPITKKELTVEEKTEIRKEKSHFGKYILLVEDETAIADVQYRILTQEPCNHKVDIANNGKIAMDLSGRNKYDLVSLDYVLPGNINGMDVYHHIRKTNNTVPVLFISGNIEFLESIKDLKLQDPYIDHVSKPCKNIDYIGCINKMFGSVGM